MYRGELNPNGVAARCGGRTKPRGCCGHHSQRDFDCAVPTLGLDDAIPGVEDPCKVQGKAQRRPELYTDLQSQRDCASKPRGCEERATLGIEPTSEQTLKGFRHPIS